MGRATREPVGPPGAPPGARPGPYGIAFTRNAQVPEFNRLRTPSKSGSGGRFRLAANPTREGPKQLGVPLESTPDLADQRGVHARADA